MGGKGWRIGCKLPPVFYSSRRLQLAYPGNEFSRSCHREAESRPPLEKSARCSINTRRLATGAILKRSWPVIGNRAKRNLSAQTVFHAAGRRCWSDTGRIIRIERR